MSNSQLATALIACAVLFVAFLPIVVSVCRGLRENHMGGIVLLNLAQIGFGLAGTYMLALAPLLGGVANAVLIPINAIVYLVLIVWAFVAPGRVQDRIEQQRHAQLLAA